MKLAIVFLKWPILSALGVTVITLVAGAASIMMADFGLPLWMFLPLFLWLGTLGLPATLGVLIVAATWGRAPSLTGFIPFVICAALAAFGLQVAFFQLCAHALRQQKL